MYKDGFWNTRLGIPEIGKSWFDKSYSKTVNEMSWDGSSVQDQWAGLFDIIKMPLLAAAVVAQSVKGPGSKEVQLNWRELDSQLLHRRQEKILGAPSIRVNIEVSALFGK